VIANSDCPCTRLPLEGTSRVSARISGRDFVFIGFIGGCLADLFGRSVTWKFSVSFTCVLPNSLKERKLKRGDESRKQSAASRNVGNQDMFVCSVRAIAVRPKAVEHGNIKRGDKVAVRSSADRLFSKFKAESVGYDPELCKIEMGVQTLKRVERPRHPGNAMREGSVPLC
jgi:hypothetical protein